MVEDDPSVPSWTPGLEPSRIVAMRRIEAGESSVGYRMEKTHQHVRTRISVAPIVTTGAE